MTTYAFVSHESAVTANWAIARRGIQLLDDEGVWLIPAPKYCVHTQRQVAELAASVDLAALGMANIPGATSAATCTAPITCTSCGEMFGSALGHTLQEATCTRGKYCTRCLKTFGKPTGHIWLEETFTVPPTCEACRDVRPMSQPASGTVYIEANKYCGSRLTIEAAPDYNTYFKLKDKDGNDVISFYVRAGKTTTVKVPMDQLYLYYASGIDWYGPDLAFGEETAYEKADDVFDFYNYTWTYTLDAGPDGNASVTIISAEEF